MTATKKTARKRAAKKTEPAEKAEPKRLLPILESQAQATSVGIPRPIIKQAKASGCAAFLPGGRIDLEILLGYLFRPDEESNVDWSREYKRWQAEREKLRYEKDCQRLGDRDEMREAMQKAFAAYDAEHERQFHTIQPKKCQGLAPAEVSQLNKTLTRKAREEAMKVLSDV